MSALCPTPAPAGSLDELREAIAERLFPLGVYLDMAAGCAAIGDDTGLGYALDHHAAHARYVESVMAMLRDRKAELARRQHREAA